jgi:hypothetical protein
MLVVLPRCPSRRPSLPSGCLKQAKTVIFVQQFTTTHHYHNPRSNSVQGSWGTSWLAAGVGWGLLYAPELAYPLFPTGNPVDAKQKNPAETDETTGALGGDVRSI